MVVPFRAERPVSSCKACRFGVAGNLVVKSKKSKKINLNRVFLRCPRCGRSLAANG